MVVQNRYTQAFESPSPSGSPSQASSSGSDDLSPGPPPDEDMYPDQPEYTLFEVVVGVTPQTLQCIRLYFHRLWQIEAPISLRFQDNQIVTFDDSIIPVHGLSRALAKRDLYSEDYHKPDLDGQGPSNLPRGSDNRGPGQRQDSRSMTFNWKQAILAMLAILLIIPQWRRFFPSSSFSHSPTFPIHRPVVEVANTVNSMPGILADITETLEDYKGNLSSMIAVPERWALACLHKDEEAGMPLFSKNRLNKAVCDAGLKEYEKATERDAHDLISRLKDLRNAIQDASYRIEHLARAMGDNLEPHIRAVLRSCIENLTMDWHEQREPSDFTFWYLVPLVKQKRSHWKYTSDSSITAEDSYLRTKLVTMNLPEALQNLEHHLTITFLSLKKVSELDLQLSVVLQKLNLTAEKHTNNETRLSWARLSLHHLRGEVQRRNEELEAFQVLLKRLIWRLYGSEGQEYVAKTFPDLPETSVDTLDMSALISIALGIQDSETARSNMGGLWRQIGWSNGGRDFDISFPSRDKQREALRFAAGGRFRGSDLGDS
ncbi:uncharacterized protein FTJAE_11510 [Fusarium tjaetaba]|uniref:Uncharacterized protein n=1 Tax=Fusarium tjaetaba TaxID=1567544 RepID=A0A8H5VG59_9HYPO|nr:uncharacterized protein FTJAE_11510 [Fusarium tjaetaba]KAF5620885.1 hypothetical protein FTJAE_11510 [Fusarium tjaetaba]